MRAGLLRHRVVLQRGSASQDSFGGVSQTWSAAGTVWAAVEPLRGQEMLDARQAEALIDTRIRIRARGSVTEVMRALWTAPDGTSHTYDIKAVVHDATHLKQIELMCAEVR
jgi:SPP1 family predicted phage head-tail adaptor